MRQRSGRLVFGQFASCNGPAFFATANEEIGANMLRVPRPGPPPGAGAACPTTRDFALVDQDQSDNVATHTWPPRTARPPSSTPPTRRRWPGATTIDNGSDNGLLNKFVDPALGCTPWSAPDLANAGRPGTPAAGRAVRRREPAPPIALVPINDPMTLINGNFSKQKTNLYRAGVDLP